MLLFIQWTLLPYLQTMMKTLFSSAPFTNQLNHDAVDLFHCKVIYLKTRLLVFFNSLPFNHDLLTTSRKSPFETMVVKGEKAGYQHFLFFPPCFLPFLNQISIIHLHLFLSSANAFNLDQSRILPFGKELKTFHVTHGIFSSANSSSLT